MLSDPNRAMADQKVVEAGSTLFPGRRMLGLAGDAPPTLLVVIDTEEEFDWRAPPNPESRSVENVQELPLLQAVFDRHGVRPAYLIDHPVASCPRAVALLRGMVGRGACEVGAHLHPWVTPPVEEPMDVWYSFGCNLAPELERRKLETLTRAIAEAFEAAPRIFKAGGYGIGPSTCGFLAELGYRVDSSVVPYTDFSLRGGPNFHGSTPQPFETAEGIVEIPLTAGFAGQFSRHGPAMFSRIDGPIGHLLHIPGFAARLSLMERIRLSPEGHGLADMVRLTRAALARGERLFMLSLHSSSLLPGATDYVRDEADRTAFLLRIDKYLHYFLGLDGARTALVSEAAEALASGSGRGM